jgi:hypothetical protein
MNVRRLIAITLLGALTALAAAGCGSRDEGDPIPASIRRQLDVQLEEAQARLANGSPGACDDITNETGPDVDRILDRVPDSVDADVRDALNEGFGRLFELVSQRCNDLRDKQTETEPDTTEETTPPETTTEEAPPTDTETTPPETTPTEPEPPTTTPGNDNGNGNGDGGGNGNGDGLGNGGVQLPGGGGSTPPDTP